METCSDDGAATGQGAAGQPKQATERPDARRNRSDTLQEWTAAALSCATNVTSGGRADRSRGERIARNDAQS